MKSIAGKALFPNIKFIKSQFTYYRYPDSSFVAGANKVLEMEHFSPDETLSITVVRFKLLSH